MNIENNIETRNEIIRAAYIAGRDAIVNQLNQPADNETVLDVVMLMAHQVLTQFGAAELAYAAHNTGVFCARLQELVETTQQNVLPSGGSARPM